MSKPIVPGCRALCRGRVTHMVIVQFDDTRAVHRLHALWGLPTLPGIYWRVRSITGPIQCGDGSAIWDPTAHENTLTRIDLPSVRKPDLLVALRALHDVCVGMDLENERERPSEQKYQAALALAEHALASATGAAA